jgi:uncharacterized repeat protein (TIGR03803 family)
MRTQISSRLAAALLLASLPATAGAATFKTLYAFQGGGDGAGPANSLLNVSGTLWGTTSAGGGSANCTGGCGTVFTINPATGVETVIYAFQGGTDGANPFSSLINVGGTLYGVTYQGGANAYGTVFSVNPTTGAERIVYSFQGGNNDGAGPIGSLLNVGGTLWGTTQFGGSAGLGTVFALNPKTGYEIAAHEFQGGFDGAFPYTSLINVGGTLMTTTEYGGGPQSCDGFGCGTVYIVYPKNPGNDGAIALFGSPNAAFPTGNVINVSGTLYGTSTNGGASGNGTVFSVALANSAEKVVYSFQGGKDGTWPGPGVLKVGSLLYGVTFSGGGSANCTEPAAGCGTLFSLNPTTGTEHVVHAFQAGNDGAGPGAALINVGGTLYGTTSGGGPSSNGTVFAYTP